MKGKKIILLFIIILLPSLFLVILSQGSDGIPTLPILGVKSTVLNTVTGKVDTVYHTIPDFSFTNHNGERITSNTVKDKITVANFFFTTCQSICPKMTMQMKRVQTKTFRWSDVILLSHTVDPEHDTIQVLKKYAKANDAIGGKWHFLTGHKDSIYEVAMKGYLVAAMEATDPGEEPFIHSELLILVDKKRRIRGFYDGTNRDEVSKLIDDIQLLKAQDFVPKKDDEQGKES